MCLLEREQNEIEIMLYRCAVEGGLGTFSQFIIFNLHFADFVMINPQPSMEVITPVNFASCRMLFNVYSVIKVWLDHLTIR